MHSLDAHAICFKKFRERKGDPMSDPIPPPVAMKSPVMALGQLLLILLFLFAGGWAIRHYVLSPDGFHRATNAAASALAPSSRVRAIVPTNAIVRTVDLLKGLDLDTATVYGRWAVRDGAIVSDTDAATRFDLGYCPPAEYDLRFSFARLSGTDGIDTILCYGGRQFVWTMAGWANTVCGFTEVCAEPADHNPTTVRGDWFKNGQRYSCVIKVRNNRVAAFLDNQLVSEWVTDYEDLASSSRSLQRTDTLGLSTWESSYAIYSVEIVEISGKGVAKLPGDPQEATEIAVCTYQVGDRGAVNYAMYSNGRMKSPEGEELWFLQGDNLIFRFGDWVDTCTLASDRRSFEGSNRNGERIFGEVVSGGL